MPEKMFRTTDLCLAAILKTKGFEIEDFERIDEKRVEFSFKITPQLQEEVKEYYKKDNELKRFYQVLKELKSIIYSL
jgi:hypothetical protein